MGNTNELPVVFVDQLCSELCFISGCEAKPTKEYRVWHQGFKSFSLARCACEEHFPQNLKDMNRVQQVVYQLQE